MAGIPPVTKIPWYHKKWFAEVLASIPPVIALIIAAIINLKDGDTTKKYMSFVGFGAAAWLLLASAIKILQASRSDQNERQQNSYDGLQATLLVLYSSISNQLVFSASDINNGRLRITIHRIVPPKSGTQSEQLEQLLPYIGGKGGQAGRRFNMRCGIVGKAARDGDAFAASRQNDNREAFIREMIADWGYTTAEARTLTEDRKSWLAIPLLLENNGAHAIVYFDSNEKDFFTPEIKNLMIHSCAGIASYCRERYK